MKELLKIVLRDIAHRNYDKVWDLLPTFSNDPNVRLDDFHMIGEDTVALIEEFLGKDVVREIYETVEIEHMV